MNRGPSVADAAAPRTAVTDGVARTEAAALRPREPGGLSWSERAAFAVRIARLGGNTALAARYEALLTETVPSFELAGVGALLTPTDARLRALVDHVDMLTARASSAGAQHIARLRAAGVEDPDIVRLSELVAFVNYQLRAELALALLESVE